MSVSAILPNGIPENKGDKYHGGHRENNNVVLAVRKVGQNDGFT
jgi:hypothetical protein